MKTNYLGARVGLPRELLAGELSFYRYSSELIKDTVIATTTMYPEKDGKMDAASELRSRLALEKIRKAAELGCDIVVLDGGSSAGWRTKARDLGAVLVDENLSDYPGRHVMGRGRRQILDFAGNYGKHKIIAWIEPEKHPFITSEQLSISPLGVAAMVVYEELADIVIPRRKDGLQSYPLQQQFEELLGSVHVTEQMRSFVERHKLGNPLHMVPYLDLWIGPRIISKEKGLQEFLDYKGEIRLSEDGLLSSRSMGICFRTSMECYVRRQGC